ncbi:MAG TPA: YfiR family protein [Usitatibacteraceae bacterium]|nr:YfiR family protein [Usitatibacteraceae bacterium]
MLAANPVLAQVSEYQVKAAFLFNFALFSQAAGTAVTAADERPYPICTMGRHNFGSALDALRAKKIELRPVEVRAVSTADEAARCQLLFLGKSEREATRRAIAAVKGKPVILVAESDHEMAEEMVFVLVLVDERVAFDFNLEVAKAHGLNVSSRLARLARNQR